MDNQNNLPSSPSFHIRKAALEDIPIVQALINLSVRTLHPPFYNPTVIKLALEQVTAIDSNHVNDGNYFIVEIEPPHASSASSISSLIVGCGGWSHRTTLYGSDIHTSSDPALLDPSTDAAKVRAMFVHPNWARKGIATMLLKACEDAAREAGFKKVELRASLQAVVFYENQGYEKVEKIDRELGGGEILELVIMKKRLVL
ncbi:acyl-CoA N-acyltransferase [Hyaloscypha sp. PMI_1271]|nr:acyl-CoA N-acyltransferase [Hyaloscypha sp. PMI_1271]